MVQEIVRRESGKGQRLGVNRAKTSAIYDGSQTYGEYSISGPSTSDHRLLVVDSNGPPSISRSDELPLMLIGSAPPLLFELNVAVFLSSC